MQENNPNIGCGLHILPSHNGWQQLHNMRADADRFVLYKDSILVTDEWCHYKSEDFLDYLIGHRILLALQPAGYSGAVGILDMQAQKDWKSKLAEEQKKWLRDDDNKDKQITIGGNLKCAPYSEQCKLLANIYKEFYESNVKYGNIPPKNDNSMLCIFIYICSQNRVFCF